MTPEPDLIRSIERIEAASRRTSPFMALGLLGIVAGFLIFIVYLNRLRTQAEAQAVRWETTASRLDVTLKETREAVRRRDMVRAAELLGVALAQTRQLAVVAREAAPDDRAAPETGARRPAPKRESIAAPAPAAAPGTGDPGMDPAEIMGRISAHLRTLVINGELAALQRMAQRLGLPTDGAGATELARRIRIKLVSDARTVAELRETASGLGIEMDDR